jgi:hypothetical protein
MYRGPLPAATLNISLSQQQQLIAHHHGYHTPHPLLLCSFFATGKSTVCAEYTVQPSERSKKCDEKPDWDFERLVKSLTRRAG